MPLYFFNTKNGALHIDETGTDLPDIDAARTAAVTALSEALNDLDGEFWPRGEWSMWVNDEAGLTVCSLNLSGETLRSTG
jgi:hypothetical protein